MVEKSIKTDERKADERHKHDQDQYFNKLKLGENIYDVDIFVDYLQPNDEYRYAGHKTTKIDNKISDRDLQISKIIIHTKSDNYIIPYFERNLNPKGENMLNDVNNDKWITIHPNGEDSKGRPLLLKDGETPQEAVERAYGKDKKDIKSDENFKENAKHLKEEYVKSDSMSLSAYQKKVKDLLKKYDKSEAEYDEVKAQEDEKKDKHSDKKDSVHISGKSQEVNEMLSWIKHQTNYDISKHIHPNGEKYDNDPNSIYIDERELPHNLLSGLAKFKRYKTEYRGGFGTKYIPINNKENNKSHNSKGAEMELLDQVKALITKFENTVENSKGEDMEKEHIDNEKVDKRDIIRQIMAIAGKHEDDEDVRTIAKLAEKLAYDESEAGTADNKAKNEDGEDEEEDKKEEAKNKCRNEEEEKLYEELKEKVEEAAANKKAKNAMDDAVNQLYSALAPSRDEMYMSQARGIELGKEIYG